VAPHPEARDLVEQAIALLRGISIHSDQFASRFAATHALHRTDMNAIAHIAAAETAGEPLGAGLLAERLQVGPSAVTAVLDRLETAGHVRREPHPGDRRRTVVRMEPRAHAVARAFFAPLGERIHAGAEPFSTTDMATVVRFLQAADEQIRAATADQRD